MAGTGVRARESGQPSVRRALLALQWTPASYALLSGFLAVIGLTVIVWWPLVIDYTSSFDPRYPWWKQVDGLLLGIFAVMSLLVMAGADIRSDGRIILVGLLGGLVIESWGTQTQLWTYYTYERPPLWILPAWPIASLAIDRLARLMDSVLPDGRRFTQVVYGVLMPGFLLLMLAFVWPTRASPLTIMAVGLSSLLVLFPGSRRQALMAFLAGAALGYFLERWGTTRLCWTYYSQQTPPLFAVLAHGMAAVAFWRARNLIDCLPARALGRVRATTAIEG
jgi:hypothetical protein